jgi:hypothetical protein
MIIGEDNDGIDLNNHVSKLRASKKGNDADEYLRTFL